MSELTLQEAVNETQKFARMLKGLEKIHETSQALAGAEQVITERKLAAAKLDEETAVKSSELFNVTREIVETRKASSEAVERAKAKAEAIVTEAEETARQAQAAADAAVAAAQAELAQVRDDLASKRAQIIAAEADLAGVLKRTSEAREAARKLIGES